MEALPYVVLIGCFVLFLGVGINRLLDRLGIRPADPQTSRGELANVAAAIERWAQRRRER